MPKPSASAQRIMAARAAMGRPPVERPPIVGTAALDDRMLAERDPAHPPTFDNGRPVEAPAEAPVEVPVAEPVPAFNPQGPTVKRSGTARAPARGWRARRSRKPEKAAPPPVIAPLVVVDAPDSLPAGDPVRLVRDVVTGTSTCSPPSASRTGRARWCVDDLVALPHLGMQTLAVAFHMSDGKSVGTWEANVGALRGMAKDVDAKLSGTPVAGLPADFMDRLQIASETRRRARLTARQQTDFNRVRVMLALLPGTGHLDLEHRDVREEGAPQWAMDAEGQPVATPKLGFTDRDIEMIAKRASLELRRTVGRWNHLAAFVNGDPAPEGPCSMDELEAAAALLRADETRAVSSRELCEVGSETWHRLHRIGWAAMGELEAEFGDELDGRLPRSVVSAIRARRGHLDAGGKDHSDFRNVSYGVPQLFVYQGWRVAAKLAFPTGQGMIAPMTLLGLQTRFNPGVLANLAETAFQPRHQHWIELDDPIAAIGQGADGPTRLYAAPYKPRARRLQPVDFPITGRIESPSATTDFLRAWTRGLREAAHLGVAEGKLCIYASLYHGESTVMSYLSSAGTMFRIEFAALCARADAIQLPPRVLRVMGVDIIHDRTAGDEMMLRAAGNWVPGSSSPRRYLAGPVQGRDRERLFWAILLLAREREHGIAVSGRPMSADLFSATDGFRCRNVMGSPDPLPPGEPCRARGLCAICPHGGLDVGAPAWSFSRIVSLARTIMERLDTAAPSWVRRYRPVLRELLDVWIPLFPDEVTAAARRLPDYPIGDLPDVK